MNLAVSDVETEFVGWPGDLLDSGIEEVAVWSWVVGKEELPQGRHCFVVCALFRAIVAWKADSRGD